MTMRDRNKIALQSDLLGANCGEFEGVVSNVIYVPFFNLSMSFVNKKNPKWV